MLFFAAAARWRQCWCWSRFLPGCALTRKFPARYKHCVLIRLEFAITPMLEQYLYRKLDVAKADEADLVIIEIESPGGYLEESPRDGPPVA